MGLVAIDKVQVGQELAKDLLDEAGRILIRKGTALTEKQLQLLRIRGIISVNVKETSATDEFAMNMARETQRLQHAFALVIDKPLMKELLNLMLQRQQRKNLS